MRIISKFHDYYDGVQNYGGSASLEDFQSIIYVREQSKIEDYKHIDLIKDDDYYGIKSYSVHRNIINFKIIGFCGKFYLVFYYCTTINNEFNIHYFYEQTLDLKVIDDYLKSKLGKSHSLPRFIKWYSNHINKNYSILNNIFLEYNTPCFIYKEGRKYKTGELIINPNLGEVEFYKVFDSYSAFQEIEMYLSNILVTDKAPSPTTDDKILLAAKGFDNNSFKSTSPGKKFKRRNNAKK